MVDPTGSAARAQTRRSIGAGLCAVLIAALLPSAALAATYEGTTVLQSADAVGAAVAFSQLTFPTGASEALLGRDDVFADALASGALQDGRPLLLTRGDSLAPATDAELERLGVKTVRILGGTGAVSVAVENQLKTAGYAVQRVSGPSRIETAIAVARAAAPESAAVILARAFAGETDPTQAFADSLSAGAWSAESGRPVLLTESAKLSDATAAYLKEKQVKQVYIVGGETAVSPAAAAQATALGATVTRVSGPTRFDTAVAIAKARGVESGAQAKRVVLVDGQAATGWSSGFAAAALAGADSGGPVLLTNGATLPEPTSAYLAPGGPAVDLVCAPSVSAEACEAAAKALEKPEAATVTLDAASVARYGSLTGSATPAGRVAALTATGCGLVDEAIPVDESGDFSVRVTGAEGTCRLILTVQSPSGSRSSTGFPLTVTEAGQATVRPELRRAEVVETKATTAKVRFIFSEAVIGTAYEPGGEGSPTAFVLYTPRIEGPDGQLIVGNDDDVEDKTTGPVRDPDRPNAVIVEFPRAGFDEATVAAVLDTSNLSAAEDPQGNFNTLGSAPLKEVVYAAGRTNGEPDLIGVGALTTSGAPVNQFKASFGFDDVAATVYSAASYQVVLDDGRVIPAKTVVTQGERTHVGLFDVSATQTPEGSTCGGAQCPTVQQAIAAARRGVLARGTSTPMQSAPVAADGVTTRPDLVSATVDPAEHAIDFTFDQTISSSGLRASGFRAYDVDGDVVSGVSASAKGTTTIRVTFGDGDVSKMLVGASVDAASVRSSGGGNAPTAIGLEQTFAAGELLGPSLTSASAVLADLSGDRYVWDIAWTFDRAVETASSSSFRVYPADGVPVTPSGCKAEGRTVTCSVTLDATDEKAPRLAAVARGAVRSADTDHENVEGSAHL
jgi:putative cell wall-binding protein